MNSRTTTESVALPFFHKQWGGLLTPRSFNELVIGIQIEVRYSHSLSRITPCCALKSCRKIIANPYARREFAVVRCMLDEPARIIESMFIIWSLGISSFGFPS